jgi:hypothetical protein
VELCKLSRERVCAIFQGKRGVWLKLPLALSHLVHPAIQVFG